MQKYLECARVSSTHGFRGTLRLECRTDSPEILAHLPRMFVRDPISGAMQELTVLHASVQKNMVLVSFAGIDTEEKALSFKNKLLYADRQDIPLSPGAHFIADLLTLPVVDDRVGTVGVLIDVISPAGQELYVVKKPDGGTFMIPAVSAFIRKISLGEEDGGCPAGVYVHLIDGMTES